MYCVDGIFVGPLAGWTARLPWEVEWEYACRAGTETDHWNGDGVEALAQVGWYDDNSGQQTHPVDEVPMADSREHPAGLVGMHGNIWEWCQDAGDDLAYAKRSDPWRGRNGLRRNPVKKPRNVSCVAGRGRLGEAASPRSAAGTGPTIGTCSSDSGSVWFLVPVPRKRAGREESE